jgi:Flp pilus assembly protein TadG
VVIEFAFVLPMLVLLLLAMIDFGFLFVRYEALTNASREGARIASMTNYNTAQVQARVASYLTTAGLTATPTTTVVPVSIATSAGGPVAAGVQVTVSYPHNYVFFSPIAGMFGNNMTSTTLTASTTMRTQAAAASTGS